MRRRSSVVALFVASALFASAASAAEPFAGPRSEIAVSVFEFPVGLRNVGMGATGVSNIAQPTNGYYNPATLAWTDAAYITYGYQNLVADLSITDGRATYGIRRGDESSDDAWRLGGEIGYTALNFNPQVIRTIFLPQGTGQTINSEYFLTAAVAGAWERGNESIGVGATTKHLTLDYSDENVGAWLFDFGLVAAVKILVDEASVRPRLGVAFANIDTGLEIDSTEYDVAGQTRVGGGVDFATPPTKLAGREVALASGSFDADYTDGGSYSSYWSIGWEVSIMDLVQARAGYQWFTDDRPYSGDRSNLTIGFGIGWEFGGWIVHADYALVSPRPNSVDIDIDRNLFGATLGARF